MKCIHRYIVCIKHLTDQHQLITGSKNNCHVEEKVPKNTNCQVPIITARQIFLKCQILLIWLQMIAVSVSGPVCDV